MHCTGDSRRRWRRKTIRILLGSFADGAYAPQAVEWAKKTPMAVDCEVEIRPMYSPEELAAWDEG